MNRSIHRTNVSVGQVLIGILATLGGIRGATGEPEVTPSIELWVSPDGDDQASGRDVDAPLATLDAARDRVRALRRGGEIEGRPVVVWLRGGRFRASGPLRLDARDSGAEGAPVTWAAWAGERPIVDGGRRITGWRVEADGTWVVDLPEVRDRRWSFRQLWVDGESRPRARKPNQGFLRVAGFPDGGREVHYHTDCQRFEFRSGDLDPSWTNLGDVEVIVYHFWTDSHLPIRSIDAESRVVTFAHKAGKVFTDDFTSRGARYVVTNVLEELDAPGEWYLDRRTGRLRYRPRAEETPERTVVVAPVAPAFLELAGDPEEGRRVHDVAFRGISFLHTNFQLPAGNSNDRQGSASVSAAIRLEGCRNVAFEGCELALLGNFAFELGAGCRDNLIRGCHIHHVGGGAVRLNGGTQRDHPRLRAAGNRILDNSIHHYGEEYPSAVGVLLMHTEGNEVAHNEIHHGWYTGVSVGWSWGYQRSVSRDNRIEHNHIHHIGQGLLSDMGGIYTLGLSPGTVIRGNRIHDVDANHYGGWGIYADEGSSHILIEDNIVHDTKFAAFNIHFSKELTVRNNIFAFGRLQQLSRSRAEPHVSVYFERNIVYWREGALLAGNWSDPPYTFHFHPKNATGTREAASTFDIDWNVYYRPGATAEETEFAGASWKEWRQRGKDVHSVWADPGFVDAEARDFRLRPDSPAIALGFRPIDPARAGPRDPFRRSTKGTGPAPPRASR